MAVKTLDITGHQICRELGHEPSNLPPHLLGSVLDTPDKLTIRCADDFPVNATISQIITAINDRNVEFYLITTGE